MPSEGTSRTEAGDWAKAYYAAQDPEIREVLESEGAQPDATPEDVTRDTIEYEAAGGTEFFLAFEDVDERELEAAETELSAMREFDYVVVNDDLAASEAGMRAILTAERLRRTRRTGLGAFLTSLD